VGAFCAALPPGYPLTAGEQRALETLGRQIGLALENIRLAEISQREIRRLRALTAASRWMTFGEDVERILAGIVATGMEIFEADRAAVYLYDPKDDRPRVGYAHGLSQEYLDHLLEVFHEAPDHRALVVLREVYVEDAWHDPRARVLWDAARSEGFRSYLVLPLIRQRTPLGALVFYHDRQWSYDPDDRRIGQALADQAAAVIENALLHQEMRQRLKELTLLHEIESRIASALSVDEVLETVGIEIQRALDISTLYIGLYVPEREEVVIPLLLEEGKRQPPITLKVSEEKGLVGWVVRTGQPLWIEDIEAEADQIPVEAIQVGEPTRTVVVLPLITKDRVIGVLSVQSRSPRAFDELQKRVLNDIAHQIAVAVENARLYTEQQRRAEESALLLEIASAINSSLELRELLKEVSLRAAQACDAQRCTILLLDEAGEWLLPVMSQFASGQPHPRCGSGSGTPVTPAGSKRYRRAPA